MSAPAKENQLPPHAYLSDDNKEHYTLSTLKGHYSLIPSEVFWRERQPFLQKVGYIVRPRYSPEWRPSWLGTNRHPIYCEDSIMHTDYQVIDATQSDTKELVAIKSFAKDSQEKDVAQFLSSLDDPQNHCVRILGILEDPLDASLAMMVMPYLRPCDNPDFGTVGDVIQFVDQTVEGLAFMHRHRIAHRDIAMKNIMMDGKALFPDGHHPVRLNYSPDAIYKVNPLPRAGRCIQYFYIDFGLACRFPEGAPPYVVGDVGRDIEVPELSSTVPYDAFKMDIFALGNLYAKEFEQKYNDMQFLIPMIERMKQRQPELRPTAEEVYNQWIEIRDSLNKNTSRWRLSPRSEAAIGRMLNDTVAVAWEGISHLKKYVT